MPIRKVARVLCSFAIVTLLAAACGGTETIIDAESATTSDENTVDTDAASAGDGASSNDQDPDAVEDSADTSSAATPAATPEPIATSAPAAEDDTGAAQDSPVAGGDSVVLTSREEAIEFMGGEGFAPEDVACLVDGAYQVFGTWNFVDLEPDPVQEEELERVIEVCVKTIPGPPEGSPPPGTDPALDALWIACSGGDPDACDNLYFEAPFDSDYELFGFSCGGRTFDDLCEDILDG